MRFFLSIIGIALGLVLLKFRQQVGDFMGEGEWMKYFGGVYNFVILLGIFLIIWSIASIFGVTDLFFRPILILLPFGRQAPPEMMLQ